MVRFSLRTRIFLLLMPPLLLLVAVCCVAGAVVYQLGGRIDAILHENYDSVIFMERLNEALERIDSSFTFALAGQEAKAGEQYAANWPVFKKSLAQEQNNITLPGEADLVRRLTELTVRYEREGELFYKQPPRSEARQKKYFGTGGLLNAFREIKEVSGEIHRINQQNMEDASREARETASHSLVWFGIALAIVLALAILIAWPIRAILRPIQSVTQSVTAIGAGNLDQVVPVMSNDELGKLAAAFNSMARQLREYRQSSYSRLLRAQRTSQASIDSFPDPVLVVDSEGFVEMANPAARRLLGVGLDNPEQRSLVPWQPPESLRQPLHDALKEQRSFLPQDFDKAIAIRLAGEEKSFLPQILPIRDPYGNTLGAAVLLQDVTRFRLLDRVKSDLVATVSHELKTPLTSIRLALHLLLEEAVGPLTPKQIELLLDARDNAERLLAQVNNLLDLTRLEEGGARLTLKPESPGDLLEAAVDAIRPRAADKGIALEMGPLSNLPAIAADAARFRHVLANLLENALTYTDRGGKIKLTAAASGDRVVFTVSDTGIGIPPEYLPYVFNRFFRVPGQSEEGGTGLGLAIAREIIAAHGGTIECRSTRGAGTVFEISLPIWKETSALPLSHTDGADVQDQLARPTAHA